MTEYLRELKDHDIVLDRLLIFLLQQFGMGYIIEYLYVRALSKTIERFDDWDEVATALFKAGEHIPPEELKMVECNNCGSLTLKQVTIVDQDRNEEKEFVVTFYCPKCKSLGKSLVWNNTKIFDSV